MRETVLGEREERNGEGEMGREIEREKREGNEDEEESVLWRDRDEACR